MRFTWTSLAIIRAILFVAVGAEASPVTWTLDPSQSQLTLSFPDQHYVQEGAIVYVRNQTGFSDTWTDGNAAHLQGTLNTDYQEGSSIQFLFGSDSLTSVNSGNYRPNPAAFNAANTSDQNPFGRFEGGLAPGAYGAKLWTLYDSFLFEVAFMNFLTVSQNLGSGALPLSGAVLGTQTTAATGIDSFGIQGASIALEGIFEGVKHRMYSLTNVYGANASGGDVSITNLGGTLRQMTIPIAVSSTFSLFNEGDVFLFNMTGQIVATANVPEPSAFLLAGVGLVALTNHARRRR